MNLEIEDINNKRMRHQNEHGEEDININIERRTSSSRGGHKYEHEEKDINMNIKIRIST